MCSHVSRDGGALSVTHGSTHLYGLSPLCVLMCVVTEELCLSHLALLTCTASLHYVFSTYSPVWPLATMCSHVCRDGGALSVTYGSTHLYGLSPLCVLMCVVTEELWEKRLSHIGQRNGFSPECVRR